MAEHKATLHNIDIKNVQLSGGRAAWIAKCSCGWLTSSPNRLQVAGDAAVHDLMPSDNVSTAQILGQGDDW